MKTARLCILILFGAGGALAQPAISNNGVLNAASYGVPQISGASPMIAPGSLAVIFGSGLGPTALTQASSLPLTTQLAGTSVTVTSGTNAYSAYLYYTSAGQVSVIVPSTVPVGLATLRVTYNGVTSNGQTVNIVRSNFGIFTRNQAGTGPGSVQNYVSAASAPLNGLSNPAREGQTLVLYGTGLGAISGPDNVAAPVVNRAGSVKVYVGGVPITPSYAGRSPQFPGVDQINFQIPSSLTLSSAASKEAAGREAVASATLSGCYVPVMIVANDAPSNIGTISISPGGAPCDHPLGLNAETLAKLDNGGMANVGQVILSRQLASGTFADVAFAIFLKGDANSMIFNGQYPLNPGSCTVFPVSPTNNGGFALNQKLLSAGAALNLNGPGVTKLLPQQGGAAYSAQDSSFLTDGNWIISGSGGTDVGAFTATLPVPPMMTWTNAAQIEKQIVPRNSPLTVTWSGGSGSDVVTISGTSLLADASNADSLQATSFVCTASASAGTFTVPTSVLQQMLAPTGPGTFASGGLLTLNANRTIHFTAPLAAGGNLDGGMLTWTFNDSRLLQWR